MRSAIRRFGVVLVASIFAALVLTPANAQDDLLRRLLITQDADYAGYDYQTLREVDQATCEQACLNDNRCRAFTYNTAATWCFLKSDFGALSFAANAVAGRILVGPELSESLERQRQDELAEFLALDYIDDARRFVIRLDETFSPGARSYSELLRAAATARSEGNLNLAANLFGAALALPTKMPRPGSNSAAPPFSARAPISPSATKSATARPRPPSTPISAPPMTARAPLPSS